jgi:hypothetical protein
LINAIYAKMDIIWRMEAVQHAIQNVHPVQMRTHAHLAEMAHRERNAFAKMDISGTMAIVRNAFQTVWNVQTPNPVKPVEQMAIKKMAVHARRDIMTMMDNAIHASQAVGSVRMVCPVKSVQIGIIWRMDSVLIACQAVSNVRMVSPVKAVEMAQLERIVTVPMVSMKMMMNAPDAKLAVKPV